MRGSSLANRLFLSATAWLVVILTITGFVLSSVYRDATERAFDRRLNLYLRTLIAEVATPDEPADRQFQSLGEPLFELPLSGWYWQITRTDQEKPETRASRSLWDKKLPKLEEHGAELTAAGIRLGYVDGPEGQTLRMVERPVDLGADGKFLVGVAGDAAEIFDETRGFDYYLGVTFTGLGIVLLLTTIFQVRFGLAPLKRISEAIADIRSGRAERLEGEFPGRDRAAGARDQRADRSQPRDRRARAHPCRQSRACDQDAAVGHRQRGIRPSRRSICRQGAGAGRRDARPGRPSSGARPHRRARHRRRHRHRGGARHRGVAPDHGENPSRPRHRHRGQGRRAAQNFAASGRISRRWSAISSTTPANGRPRRSSSRCWWNRRPSRAPAPLAHRRR